MVDAQTDDAVLDEAPDPGVRGVEDLRVLDADAGQRGDGEEAAVAELGVAAAEGHQPVVLALVHRLGVVAGGPGARREREAVLVVAELALAVQPVGDDLEHGVRAEDRQQQRGAGPVDVEPARVRGVGTEAEHVPPGRVLLGLLHPEVVGHDVDHEVEVVLAGGGHEVPPALVAPARRVELGRVDRVVAVVRAAGRAQQGGAVDGADPEVAQVAGERRSVVEREARVDLEAVGRGGHGACHASTLEVRRAAPVRRTTGVTSTRCGRCAAGRNPPPAR